LKQEKINENKKDPRFDPRPDKKITTVKSLSVDATKHYSKKITISSRQFKT